MGFILKKSDFFKKSDFYTGVMHPTLASITIEWSVTEVPLEDRYEIDLDATYETKVPAPVVLWDPLVINLPEMAPGEVFYGELGLTNHGLIRAYNLDFHLPDDQYFKYEWLAALPESLEAGERVVIPYRVTALSPFSPDGGESGGGCSGYSNAATVGLDYICANGDEQEPGRVGKRAARYLTSAMIYPPACPPSLAFMILASVGCVFRTNKLIYITILCVGRTLCSLKPRIY